MRKREYQIEDIEIKEKGYIKRGRKVIRNGTKGKYAFITLPIWMVGKVFDMVLIPREDIEDGI
jgi:hypothetical protein